jgi:hypothetical protein
LVKNLELRNLLVYGSAHLVVHLLTIVFFLSQRRVHDALGLMLALPRAIVDLPVMWGKRRVVQRFRVVSDKEIFRDVLKISTTDYLRRHVATDYLRRHVARRMSGRP